MLLADNKFKTFHQAQMWNAPSPEEEKILALETQIQKLLESTMGSGATRWMGSSNFGE